MSWLPRCSIIFLSCFFPFIGLASAYSEPTNNFLQTYRDEIQQSETNASQAVLDVLQANADTDNDSQQKNQPASAAPPTPRSNNDKAFTPSDNNSANATHPLNKNPWIKPNPWAKQPPNIWEKNAKINPYSNAPIPGPTPPSNASTNLAIPSPPNIFAPSQPAPNTNKARPHD